MCLNFVGERTQKCDRENSGGSSFPNLEREDLIQKFSYQPLGNYSKETNFSNFS